MAQHNIALKRREVGIINLDGREFAKAGVDAIDRLMPRQYARNRGGAFGDAHAAGRVKRRGRATIERAPFGEGDGAGRDHQAHWPLHMRAWSGFAPR